jgi:transcriptional regulator with XRE-family HTH domain
MPSKTAAPQPPGVRLTVADRQAHQKWIETNPLRAWRLSQDPKVTILEAAELLGVGMSMVQMYERGVHKPGSKATDGFATYLGADWSERWDAWLAERPRPAAASA